MGERRGRGEEGGEERSCQNGPVGERQSGIVGGAKRSGGGIHVPAEAGLVEKTRLQGGQPPAIPDQDRTPPPRYSLVAGIGIGLAKPGHRNPIGRGTMESPQIEGERWKRWPAKGSRARRISGMQGTPFFILTNFPERGGAPELGSAFPAQNARGEAE